MGSMPPPRRNYLLTYPRSASNLLVKILSLKEQPDIISLEKYGGYYFLDLQKTMYLNLDLGGTDPNKWTPEQRKTVVTTYKKCFAKFQNYLDEAANQGKGVFVKEHLGFIVSPFEEAEWYSKVVKNQQWSIDASHYPFTDNKQYGISQEAKTEVTEPKEGYMADIDSVHHSENNNTIYSDEFLLSWQPTFLVRHPALMFPSLLRAEADLVKLAGGEYGNGESFAAQNGIICTLRWMRSLYDWYHEQFSKMSYPPKSADSSDPATWPIILDADDFITNPESVRRYCRIVGLDENQIHLSWEVASKAELDDTEGDAKRMLSTLQASNTVLKSKSSANINIDVEAKKWKEEFGEIVGAQVEKWVRDAMPDYEYLRERRFKLNEGL